MPGVFELLIIGLLAALLFGAPLFAVIVILVILYRRRRSNAAERPLADSNEEGVNTHP